jgi:polyribonucleotide nucleotidyltransferase
MATVCGGSLALMDAGVPVAAPVAGIAMGLIKEGEHVRVLSDILGDEDHLGDMDFKVAGTPSGVTSLQMDIKVSGVNRDVMRQALYQAREGRMHILGIMDQTIASHRENVSGHAPRIITIKVKPDKIREIIGPGGKVIRGIIEATGVKMDVEDDGTVIIASSDEAAAQKAVEMVQRIAAEAEIGKIYKGTVRKIVEFGAFVEILPGTDGLVHISQLALERVRRVTDVLKEGDEVMVKVLEIDRQGKIRLSRKEALLETGGDSENFS